MKKNKAEIEFKKEYSVKKMSFSGAEISVLRENKRLKITEQDGNPIQRTLSSWEDEQKNSYFNSLKFMFPHQPFYIIKFDEWYVVDGQHRLEYICEKIKTEGLDDSFKLSTKLFEFVAIDVRIKSFEELIEEGGNVFRVLNDTSKDVVDGAIYKLLFGKGDLKKSETLLNDFETHFKITKTKEKTTDRDKIYDALGVSAYAIRKWSAINSDDYITDTAKDFLNSLSKAEMSKLLQQMIDILSLMKSQKVFANKNNSVKNIPIKKYLVPLFALANEIPIVNLLDASNRLNILFQSGDWNSNPKKSRSAGSIKHSTYALIYSFKNPGKDIIGHFNDSK